MLEKKLTVHDMIMWNGIAMDLYIKSHNPRCLSTVIQFLEVFKWDKNALAALKFLVKKHGLQPVKAQSRVTKIKGKKVPIDIEEPPAPRMILGLCPQCQGVLKGMHIASCETRETGRIFYKECSDCNYYSEILVIDDVVIEKENRDGT